eukprot:m.61490 g.61490  ORF g.61490 m.61490 type:complete len:84 (+) comp13343_c0_seq1:1264-1515(+)
MLGSHPYMTVIGRPLQHGFIHSARRTLIDDWRLCRESLKLHQSDRAHLLPLCLCVACRKNKEEEGECFYIKLQQCQLELVQWL